MMKLFFFDIDGTLVGFGKNDLLDSTRKALAEARQAGHKLFICTGRSVMQVPQWLKEEGFDGIVASAGAHILYAGSEIYFRAIPDEVVRKAVNLFISHRILFLLQAKSRNYIWKENFRGLVDALAEKGGFSQAQVEKLLGGCTLIDDPDKVITKYRDPVLSMLYEKAPIDLETVRSRLAPELHVNPSSFNVPDQYSGEITQMEINKAVGMQKVIEYFHVSRADTVAFGDGYNDVEMLQFAGTGVAMGNAPDDVKKCADLVTDPLEEDGLYHAMMQLI